MHSIAKVFLFFSNYVSTENLLGVSCLHSLMLCVHMRLCPWCRLEGHGAQRAFEEDLTVSALDMGLKSSNIWED